MPTGNAPWKVDFLTASYGEVSEWLKEHAWKVCKRLNTASRVRIPPSPPYIFCNQKVRRESVFIPTSRPT